MSNPEEELPFIELTLGGEPFTATPLNSHLFTFAGRTVLENGLTVENSTYNHVFLYSAEEQEPDDGVLRGTYVFQPEIVQQMGSVMIAYGFPCRLSQRYVQECDIQAYNTYVERNAEYFAEELGDFIPEDWENDGTE